MVTVKYQDSELRIRWRHFTQLSEEVARKGTECMIFDATGDPRAIGASFVHPKDKVFDRKLGRLISLGRALVDFGIQNQSDRKRLIAEATKCC